MRPLVIIGLAVLGGVGIGAALGAALAALALYGVAQPGQVAAPAAVGGLVAGGVAGFVAGRVTAPPPPPEPAYVPDRPLVPVYPALLDEVLQRSSHLLSMSTPRGE